MLPNKLELHSLIEFVNHVKLMYSYFGLFNFV